MLRLLNKKPNSSLNLKSKVLFQQKHFEAFKTVSFSRPFQNSLSKTFNSRKPLLHEKGFENLVGDKKVGLFGIEGLNSPQDWTELGKDVLTQCGRIIQELESDFFKKEKNPRELLFKLDSISRLVCSVIDPAELCRNVHPDEGHKNKANEVVQVLANFIHSLNTNSLLHRISSFIYSSETSPEGKYISKLLKEEFESSGVHLPQIQQKQIGKLQEEIANLNRDYLLENDNPNDFDTFQAPKSSLKNSYAKIKNYVKEEGDFVVLSTKPFLMDHVLNYVPDANVRKNMFILGICRNRSNIKTLQELVKKRHQLAVNLGFSSFAHMTLSNNRMAKKPEEVTQFLEKFSEKLRPKATEELELLKKVKLEQEGQSEIYGWDKNYYSTLVKSQAINLEGKNLASYFSLGSCMEGLNLIVTNLFGIRIEPVPLQKGESWHPSVYKVQLVHETEGLIGYIYLDLFPRSEKTFNAATFALEFAQIDPKTQNTRTIPKVALVCSIGSFDGGLSLLNLYEVETLFHEFGHCLSGILSRTEFHHASGTRGALDFIETPSTLMEFYVYDHRVVKEFARHYKTGEILPENILKSMRKTRYFFSGMDTQFQIVSSLFDQKVHSTSNPNFFKLTQELQNQHTFIPYIEGTHWFSSFSHLAAYAAGYYSYLYSRIFSSSIWHQSFSKNPFDRNAGEKYRREILQYGGSKDPKEMLKGMLGSELSVDGFLEEIEAK